MPLSTLVVGARGAVGRIVLDQLRTAGPRVRASTRRLEPGAFPPGVEVRQGDLTEPATLPALFEGVEQVFLYALGDGVEEVVEAIDAAGIRRVVLLSSGSVLQPQAADNPIAVEHRRVEEAFAQGRATVVPIRPLVLATNTLPWFQTIRAGLPLPLFRPEATTAPVHERDVAAVALEALAGRDDVSGTLTGPSSLSQHEQALLLGAAVGRAVQVRELGRDAERTRLRLFLPDDEVEGVLAFLDDAADGGSPVTSTVPDVLGRPAASFTDWAADHARDLR